MRANAAKPPAAGLVGNRPARRAADLHAAAAQPTVLDDFAPNRAPAGTIVTVNGTNFDNTAKVYFGGVQADTVIVASDKRLTAQVPKGGSATPGPVKVVTAAGTGSSAANFTFVPVPTISQVIPTKLVQGASFTLIGTGFNANTTVTVDGTPVTNLVLGSSTTISATVNGAVTTGVVTVTDPTGVGSAFNTNAGGNGGVGGNADFTLPGVGDQVLVIPTPTFTYVQPHPGDVFSFEVKVWGNSLGTDSSMQRVANKLLLPQTSILGMQGEFNWVLAHSDTTFALNLVADLNFLLKKISYLDTTGKNNFNPWAFHPRIGLAATFWNNNVYAGFYYNFMNILTNYDQFKAFFQCGNQNVFVYPEANIGALFPIGGNGKQRLKFELDGIFNNKDVNKLYNQYSGMIISVKAGFVTTF